MLLKVQLVVLRQRSPLAQPYPAPSLSLTRKSLAITIPRNARSLTSGIPPLAQPYPALGLTRKPLAVSIPIAGRMDHITRSGIPGARTWWMRRASSAGVLLNILAGARRFIEWIL